MTKRINRKQFQPEKPQLKQKSVDIRSKICRKTKATPIRKGKK